jgi:hypothetical protein
LHASEIGIHAHPAISERRASTLDPKHVNQGVAPH